MLEGSLVFSDAPQNSEILLFGGTAIAAPSAVFGAIYGRGEGCLGSP